MSQCKQVALDVLNLVDRHDVINCVLLDVDAATAGDEVILLTGVGIQRLAVRLPAVVRQVWKKITLYCNLF